MEEMEQPKEKDGSIENYGKFKDAESLLKAYNNLESEFTKKSQKLSALLNEVEDAKIKEERLNEINQKVDDFVTKFEAFKPFTSTLKESLKQEGTSLEEEALKLITNNYKTAEDYISDSEFLNNYVYSNSEIKDKIVKDYLSKITQSSPIKMAQGSANIPLTPPQSPSTIQEAGRLAKSILRQK